MPEAERRDQVLANAERYLAALRAGHFEAAAACFTEDVIYSHPAYPGDPGTTRHEVRGRAALIELFRRRGVLPVQHRVVACVVAGDLCFIEGTFAAAGDATTGSFVSSARTDDAGRFASYVAYSSIPAAGTPAADRGV